MKGAGGRGRLTHISLTNCETIIGWPSGDLNGMKSATVASLFHVASSATMIFISIAHLDQIVGAYSKQIKQMILARINQALVYL